MIRHGNRGELFWAILGSVVAGLALSTSAAAQEEAKADADPAPVKRIVLFTSGVGYFEHQGKVQGDAKIDLEFDVDDVNDLLKSMVLQDLDGGKISTVTYGSRDPITRTLKSFSVDLTDSPTLGQLLAQIRGERIEIDAPTKVEGTIVGVEKKNQAIPDAGMIELEYLTLLTEGGLRRVPLDSIGRIKLANPELEQDFRKALSVLATGHAVDKKSVTLEFLGEGERNVRVGYIQEAPVWKTSYRLVIGDDEQEQASALLQGWAIVENTTDADWKDVRLSLVSGRPVSFVMDLYSPLYAERPVVTPELYASLRPQMYDQDLEPQSGKGEEAQEQLAVVASAAPAAAPAPAAPMIDDAMGMGGIMARRAMGRSQDGPARMALANSLGDSVRAAAQGADVGELFKYEIENPVTLPRQSSAMLPILNDKIKAAKVSIYNVSADAKHPMDGIRITNSSELQLMQGPVTVFDGGVYAGDARLPDLAAGDERLLSYALDLDVEVAPSTEAKPLDLVSVRIEKGVLQAKYVQQRTQTYAVKNSGDKAKSLLIEHPLQGDWELLEPKEPAEKTRDLYRFAVSAEPGKSAELVVKEQQVSSQAVGIADHSDDSLLYFVRGDKASEATRSALQEVIRRRTEIAQLVQRKQQVEQEIAAIDQEQNRIRENMRSIDRNIDLYTRYVTKLSTQEDQIEKLRADRRTAEAQANEAQAALSEYLANLTLE